MCAHTSIDQGILQIGTAGGSQRVEGERRNISLYLACFLNRKASVLIAYPQVCGVGRILPQGLWFGVSDRVGAKERKFDAPFVCSGQLGGALD